MNSSIDFHIDAPVGEPMRVLQLTDMQIIDAGQQRFPERLGANSWKLTVWAADQFEHNCYEQIRQLVADTKPHLILITGDIVYGEFDDAGTTLDSFLDFMGSLNTPWAPVFGNHDNESKLGVTEQCRRYAAARNCLFARGDVTGNSNYTIGIYEGGRLARVLYMTDSNGCYGSSDPEVRRQRGFGDDQLAWLESVASTVDAPGILCCHIPTEDCVDALTANGYQSEEALDSHGNFVIGADVPAAHPDDCGYKNEVMLRKHCLARMAPFYHAHHVDGMLVGHFHKINTSILHEGVRYVFGTKTGIYDYHTLNKTGGTLLTMDEGLRSFTVKHIYLPMEESFEP